MPKYEIELSTTINITIEVEAEKEEDIEYDDKLFPTEKFEKDGKNWWKYTELGYKRLEDARYQVVDRAHKLDYWEFDIEEIKEIKEPEEPQNNAPLTTL